MANENKMTPGKWRIGNAGKAIFQPTGTKLIADLQGCENARANAQAIAAVPELIAALQELRFQASQFMSLLPVECRDALEQAEEALTKAGVL